ncbi:hypothetical protein [Paenibacillus glycanilyticus]|uniref:hypothetical protein n=1 Tax=Paenibacillus glycanilyticus TaxID=126569 RepID=UPI001910F75C|nr:hypothetical protein [Paenibacillus glycanilyticus]
MWKIDRDEYIILLTSAFDQFVDDFIAWTLDNQQIKLEELQLRIRDGNCRITKLAQRATKVRDYLCKFCSNSELNTVASMYYYYTSTYHVLPATGINNYSLIQETQELIHDAFGYFYDQLIDTIAFHNIYIHNYSGLPELKQEFRKYVGDKHPVCPYCDYSEIDIPRFSSIDHFFPKGRYALLSIYSNNLVLACAGCNDRIKGEHVTIPIFHPYFYNPDDYFYLSLDHEYETIEFIAKNDEYKVWVENFNNSFKLEELYNKRIRAVHSETGDLRGKVRRAFRNYKKTPLQGLKRRFETDGELIEFLLMNHIRYAIHKNKQLRGKEPLRKLKIDFYEQMLNIYFEKEKEYLLNIVS